MNKLLQCQIAKAQAELALITIHADNIQEYQAPWLKNARTIFRDHGKFASKSTSEMTSKQEKEEKEYEEIKKAIADAAWRQAFSNKFKNIKIDIENTPSPINKIIGKAMKSPLVKKAYIEISKAFHDFDVEAGTAFDTISRLLQGKGAKPKKDIEKIEDFLEKVIDASKKKPAMAVLGVLGAVTMASGSQAIFNSFLKIPKVLAKAHIKGSVAAEMGNPVTEAIKTMFPQLKTFNPPGGASRYITTAMLSAALGLSGVGFGAVIGAAWYTGGAIAWETAWEEISSQMEEDASVEDIETLSGKIKKILNNLAKEGQKTIEQEIKDKNLRDS